jgi:type IX secretion system PorP/SprF family membrane protein
MEKRILLLLFVFAFFAAETKSQDFHLSQYDVATMYTNPALTGMYFEGSADYRGYAAFRQQWRALGKPFTSAYAGYDMPFGTRFGFGGYILNNRAGLASFNNMNIMLSGSYKIIEDPTGKHFMSAGVQMGLFQKSFNPQALFFDAQYSSITGGFDSSIGSGESFFQTRTLKPNAGLGAFYRLNSSEKRFIAYGGFSLFNILKPNESFTGQKSRLPMRFVLHGGGEYRISQEVSLGPTLLYMHQGRSNELNIGIMGDYILSETPYKLLYGLAYRNKDAAIVHIGIKHGENTFRISYDINTSPLSTFTNKRGGFEFTAIYSGLTGRAHKALN